MAMAAPVVLNPGPKGLLDGHVTFLKGVPEFVNKTKIELTQRTLAKLARVGRWPDDDNYRVYLGRGRSQRYKDPATFFRVMKAKPNLYPRRWVFEPNDVGSTELLVEAIAYAYMHSVRASLKHHKSGRLKASFLMLEKLPTGHYRVMTTPPFKSDVTRDTEFLVLNFAEYASTIEAHAYQRVRDGGVMYLAAKMTEKKFKSLVVTFQYMNMDRMGLPLTHKYMVPVIRIGMRGNKQVGKISRPGKNLRRRMRKARSLAANRPTRARGYDRAAEHRANVAGASAYWAKRGGVPAWRKSVK